MGQDTADRRMGPETAKRTPDEITAIRDKYFDNTQSLRSIYTAHNMSDHALRRLRREQGWAPRRPRKVTTQSLVRRLLRLVEEHVGELEEQKDRPDRNGLEETEVGALAKTAATLQKLIAMETAHQREAKPRSKRMTETQVRLAQRLEELRRR